jgi:hypothetical protein
MNKERLRGTLIIYGFIFGCLGFFVLIFGIAFNTLRFHPVYKQGMEMVRNDPDVIELFGSPIRAGRDIPLWWWNGQPGDRYLWPRSTWHGRYLWQPDQEGWPLVG